MFCLGDLRGSQEGPVCLKTCAHAPSRKHARKVNSFLKSDTFEAKDGTLVQVVPLNVVKRQFRWPSSWFCRWDGVCVPPRRISYRFAGWDCDARLQAERARGPELSRRLKSAGPTPDLQGNPDISGAPQRPSPTRPEYSNFVVPDPPTRPPTLAKTLTSLSG